MFVGMYKFLFVTYTLQENKVCYIILMP